MRLPPSFGGTEVLRRSLLEGQPDRPNPGSASHTCRPLDRRPPVRTGTEPLPT
jgi:hypothetical protein